MHSARRYSDPAAEKLLGLGRLCVTVILVQTHPGDGSSVEVTAWFSRKPRLVWTTRVWVPDSLWMRGRARGRATDLLEVPECSCGTGTAGGRERAPHRKQRRRSVG